VLLGLVVFCVELFGKWLQALGLWAAATGLLLGSGALVLWPRQLVVRNAGNVGTRHPGVARGCGLFGLGAAVFFEVVASAAWRGHFHWPTFALACGASAACGVVGLRRLRRSLHPAARPV